MHLFERGVHFFLRGVHFFHRGVHNLTIAYACSSLWSRQEQSAFGARLRRAEKDNALVVPMCVSTKGRKLRTGNSIIFCFIGKQFPIKQKKRASIKRLCNFCSVIEFKGYASVLVYCCPIDHYRPCGFIPRLKNAVAVERSIEEQLQSFDLTLLLLP